MVEDKKTKSSFEKLIEKYGHCIVTAPMNGRTNISSTIISTRLGKGMVPMKLTKEDMNMNKKLAGRHSPISSTKKPTIIGIIGNMGSGKTTIGKMMEKAGLVNEERAFAGKICKMAELFVDAGYLERDEDGKLKRTIELRQIKQGIGLKMRELCQEVFGHKEVWIDAVFNTINDDTVITDVRMPIEAERILKAGGYLIYLNISNELRRERIEKRDNMKFTMKQWRRLHYHDTEKNVKVIYDNFWVHSRFIEIDASKSLEDIQINLIQEFFGRGIPVKDPKPRLEGYDEPAKGLFVDQKTIFERVDEMKE